MPNHVRMEQIKKILNPQNRPQDPLSDLRDRLVNPGQDHRGGPEQREFLQAVAENDFLTYLSSRHIGDNFVNMGLPLLPDKLQEAEFVRAPVTTAQSIWDTYRTLIPQEAASVSVWNAVTLYNVQYDRLEASYLVAASEKVSGRERIQKVLRTGKKQPIDDCVRTVFRSMGGLRRIRGNASVISDCTLSRYWWMGKVIEDTTGGQNLDESRVWEELNRYWSVIAEWAVRRLTIIANPVLMAGLISYLLVQPVPTQEHMRRLLRRIGMIFSEVSPYAWSAHEVKQMLLQGEKL